MIPADVASRLRPAVAEQPAAVQVVTQARQIADVLSDLVPGQRLMAEIQSLLPSGAYRAMVAQREVTLALPFAAKQGDTLELEVTESDGKLVLAFVANRGTGKENDAAAQSVPTRFSATGRLIGDLLAGVGGDGKKAPPAPLNGNLPLVEEMPASPRELVPVLREALGKSGMFYEAHQARWAAGKLAAETLLQQPQGRLSPGTASGLPSGLLPTAGEAGAPPQPSSSPPTGAAGTLAAAVTPAPVAEDAPQTETARTGVNRTLAPPLAGAGREETAALRGHEAPLSTAPSGQPVRSELTPLVQQQLDALASQNFVWQGQVWPGQQMHWEISADEEGKRQGEEEAPQQWQTRLHLSLPRLGGVEASIRLHGGDNIEIDIKAATESGHVSLAAASGLLRQRLEEAGLKLAHWTLARDDTTV